jgi:alpha-1,3-mannosyltransferase
MSLLSRARDLAQNPDHARWMVPLLLVVDAALCGVVIEKVACTCPNPQIPNHDLNSMRNGRSRSPDTEIDWSTYMQQISLYLKGERDYAKISGDTGPLVYPGAHVWIYSQLYKITNQGKDVERAQWVFALVYLGTLGVVLGCYRRARVSFLGSFLISRLKRGGWKSERGVVLMCVAGPAICSSASDSV